MLLLFHLPVHFMRHDISPFFLNLKFQPWQHWPPWPPWPSRPMTILDHPDHWSFPITLTSEIPDQWLNLTDHPEQWPFLTQATITALTAVSLINWSRNQLLYTDTLLLLWYHEFTCFFTVRRQFLTEDWGMWISKSWAPSKMWFHRAAWFDLMKIRVIPAYPPIAK